MLLKIYGSGIKLGLIFQQNLEKNKWPSFSSLSGTSLHKSYLSSPPGMQHKKIKKKHKQTNTSPCTYPGLNIMKGETSKDKDENDAFFRSSLSASLSRINEPSLPTDNEHCRFSSDRAYKIIGIKYC